MNDIFGRIVSLLVCIYLMFLFPLTYAKEESRIMQRTYLYSETAEFLDSIRNTGVIADRDLKVYLQKVAKTGEYRAVFLHKSESGMLDRNTEEICEVVQADGEYRLDYQDFIKVTVYRGEQMLFVYGGSVRAKNSREGTG